MSWVRSHKVLVGLIIAGALAWYLYTQTTGYAVSHADVHVTYKPGMTLAEKARAGGF